MTKRATARQLMAELKQAYAAIDTKPYEDDPDRMTQAVGYYDGLRRAYVLLTGRKAPDVAQEVVSWYVGTLAYKTARERYGQGG